MIIKAYLQQNLINKKYVFFSHKKAGNYCLLNNENEKNIKYFNIDKDKFCFKLIGGQEKEDNINIKNLIFLVKEFIKMELFPYYKKLKVSKINLLFMFGL